MDDNQRLHLHKMIAANNVEDTTELIRQLKHSVILTNDVNDLLRLKIIHKDDPEQLQLEAMTQCNFLFTYYTDIFNKIKKDEIDLTILFEALAVLKEIEDCKIDQHEGAFKFGTLLKKIYVDSALKKAEKLNTDDTPSEYRGAEINVSWKQWKGMNKHV